MRTHGLTNCLFETCFMALILCPAIALAESAPPPEEPGGEDDRGAEVSVLEGELGEPESSSAPPAAPQGEEPEPPPAPWNQTHMEQPSGDEDTPLEADPADREGSEPHQVEPVAQRPDPTQERPQSVGISSVVEHEPRSWHINVLGDATPMFVRHSSFDALEADDSIALVGATVEGGYTLRDAIPIMAQVSYGWAALGEPLFEELQMSLEAHSLQIGVMAGYRFWDAMMPYVRAGLTLTWADLSIDGGGDSVEGRSFAPGFYATAGVELALARRWIERAFRTTQFTIGIRLEAGYTYLGRFEFTEETDESTLVTHTNAQLGTLQLDGATIRLSFLLSF